jgi:hypothetical protein
MVLAPVICYTIDRLQEFLLERRNTNMGIYVNPGKENFEVAVRSQIYVDKTGLLEYTNSILGTEQRCMCVSRPRRFGKSMAANMMMAYYSKGADSAELFGGLQIRTAADYEEHLNAHNVIYLDVASFLVKERDVSLVVDSMQLRVIEELRSLYPDAVRAKEDVLVDALADVNQKTGEKFIVIIDEWDAIFREKKTDQKLQEQYVNFLRGMFKSGQSAAFIELAYLTGILPIKRYNSESALNNFTEFTMLDPGVLSEYIGFTEDEVKRLCQKYDMNFQETKRWYDGYAFYNLDHVYNPNSVVKAMQSHRFNSYWTNTTAFSSLTDLIVMNFDGLKDSVLQLLAGERVPVSIASFQNDMTNLKNQDNVLTLLVHLGYLAFDDDMQEVYIPNEEVKTSFYNAIADTGWETVMEAYAASNALLQATIRGDADAVAAGVDAVHMKNTSIINYNDENALSCVITLAYYNANSKYILQREQPAGKGYADIVFRPRRRSGNYPAMIVELKVNKSPESALAQIKERRYVEALEDYQGKVLLVGVNYDKDTKEHTCVIEEWEKE